MKARTKVSMSQRRKTEALQLFETAARPLPPPLVPLRGRAAAAATSSAVPAWR